MRTITGKDTQYKLFWIGNQEGNGGVGVMLAEKWIHVHVHVNRVNDRLMLLKVLVGKRVVTIISTYAPQQGVSFKKILLDSTEKVYGHTKGPVQRKSTWWCDEKVENVIKEKRRCWKEWKNGSCRKERYIEAKRVARRQVYEVKSKAETEQFGNLSTSKNSQENAFGIAKHIANANKDVIGDTCVKNDCLVFTGTEVESMEGTL